MNDNFIFPLYLLEAEQPMNWFQDQQEQPFYPLNKTNENDTILYNDYSFDLSLLTPSFESTCASVSSTSYEDEDFVPVVEKKRGRKRKNPVKKHHTSYLDSNKHTTHSSTRCTNCKTGNTPLWRRNPQGQPLCNACGLFLKLHGTVRPISLKTDIIKKRNRSGSRRKQQDTEPTSSQDDHTTLHKVFNNQDFYM